MFQIGPSRDNVMQYQYHRYEVVLSVPHALGALLV